MRHTFHVSFVSHLGLKRKYCFSVSDANTRTKWGNVLQRQINSTTTLKRITVTDHREKIRHAAEVVSLQVLRDALIPPEDKPEEPSRTVEPPPRPQRMGSVSLAYPLNQGRGETQLGPLVPGRVGAKGDANSGMVECKNGKELVLLCRQNSLLPGVLELLQSGLPSAAKVDAHAGAAGAAPVEGVRRVAEVKEVVLGPVIAGPGGGRTMSTRNGGGRI